MNYVELVNFLAETLGFGLPELVLFLTVLGSIILFAKDFRVGLLALFMLTGIEFALFSIYGYETFKILLALFLELLLLSLSLYAGRGTNKPGFV